MGLFSLFRPKHEILREKIIFTQKARISSLEHEVDDLRRVMYGKDKEMKETRTNFEKSKERLVDQIVTLSDKFADVNHRLIDLTGSIRLTRVEHPAIERRKKGITKEAKAKKQNKSKKQTKKSQTL